MKPKREIESWILFKHILTRGETFINDIKNDRDWQIRAEAPQNTKMRVSSGRSSEKWRDTHTQK